MRGRALEQVVPRHQMKAFSEAVGTSEILVRSSNVLSVFLDQSQDAQPIHGVSTKGRNCGSSFGPKRTGALPHLAAY